MEKRKMEEAGMIEQKKKSKKDEAEVVKPRIERKRANNRSVCQVFE